MKKKGRRQMKGERASKLLVKLATSLPLDEIKLKLESDPEVPGSEGSASWYDYDGVTYGDTKAEQTIINNWLLEQVGKKLGYRVKRIREDDGNGHCTMWFRRAEPVIESSVQKAHG